MAEITSTPTIKRGDAYNLAVLLQLGDEQLLETDLDMIHCVEFMIGEEIRHVYPDDTPFGDGAFLVPLSQAETFSLNAGEKIPVDIRVHFAGGDVLGTKQMIRVKIVDALSEVEL